MYLLGSVCQLQNRVSAYRDTCCLSACLVHMVKTDLYHFLFAGYYHAL